MKAFAIMLLAAISIAVATPALAGGIARSQLVVGASIDAKAHNADDAGKTRHGGIAFQS